MSNLIKSKTILIMSVFTLFCALSILLPIKVFAADYPSATNQSFTGTTAKTQVALKTDESQLSFTAPSVINFALLPNGNFAVPDAGAAFIKNNSVIPIKVSSYAVTSKSGATGVDSVDKKTSNDTYQIFITGSDGKDIPFAINSANDWAGWVLGGAGSATEKCSLTFKNAKMINPSGSIWHNGAALQEVVWTITSNV